MSTYNWSFGLSFAATFIYYQGALTIFHTFYFIKSLVNSYCIVICFSDGYNFLRN
jgi:hypothetical protein